MRNYCRFAGALGAILLSLLFAAPGKSMRMRRQAPAGAARQGSAPRGAAAGKSLRVLFIGNSLTAANYLPFIVQALARAAGDSLEEESLTMGGAGLDDHWNDPEARRTIARGGWDVVVLQQGPSSLPESRVHIRHWTQKFAEVIRQAGARPALFMVWPAIDRLAFFDDVRDSYSLAAADVGGIFLPAGEAWRAAWRRDPKAPLYSSDDFHPSTTGSYLAALSIFGILYNRAPQNLTARLTLANGQILDLPPAQAKVLQDSAAEANQRYGRP
jgi:hypothetical protein